MPRVTRSKRHITFFCHSHIPTHNLLGFLLDTFGDWNVECKRCMYDVNMT